MKVKVNLPVLLRDQERSGRRTDMGFGYLSLDTWDRWEPRGLVGVKSRLQKSQVKQRP